MHFQNRQPMYYHNHETLSTLQLSDAYQRTLAYRMSASIITFYHQLQTAQYSITCQWAIFCTQQYSFYIVVCLPFLCKYLSLRSVAYKKNILLFSSRSHNVVLFKVISFDSCVAFIPSWFVLWVDSHWWDNIFIQYHYFAIIVFFCYEYSCIFPERLIYYQ